MTKTEARELVRAAARHGTCPQCKTNKAKRHTRTDPLHKRWATDFDLAAKAIPEAWLVREPDGFVGIHPDHADEQIVQLYAGLTRVGYARGWLNTLVTACLPPSEADDA
jgi:hypothetical protein